MSRRRQPVAILPVLAEDGTQRFSGDGIPFVTRMWGEGASLADAGWQLAKEQPMSHVEKVESIAKERNITFAEALDTAEGREAYNTYMSEEREAPTSAPAGYDDKLGRAFAGDASTFKGIEANINERVTELLANEGKHAPTPADRVDAMNRLLASEPELYSEYIAEQRRAIGR